MYQSNLFSQKNFGRSWNCDKILMSEQTKFITLRI